MTYEEFKEQGGILTEKEFNEQLENMTKNFNRDTSSNIKPKEFPVKVVNGKICIHWLI